MNERPSQPHVRFSPPRTIVNIDLPYPTKPAALDLIKTIDSQSIGYCPQLPGFPVAAECDGWKTARGLDFHSTDCSTADRIIVPEKIHPRFSFVGKTTLDAFGRSDLSEHSAINTLEFKYN